MHEHVTIQYVIVTTYIVMYIFLFPAFCCNEVCCICSWVHVYNMYNALKPNIPASQRVTFPINASLLKGSIAPLKWLCEQFDASLTIWQSEPEAPVDISELVYARFKFPHNRIYYDLPRETMDKFTRVADDNTSLTDCQYILYIYVAHSLLSKRLAKTSALFNLTLT